MVPPHFTYDPAPLQRVLIRSSFTHHSSDPDAVLMVRWWTLSSADDQQAPRTGGSSPHLYGTKTDKKVACVARCRRTAIDSFSEAGFAGASPTSSSASGIGARYSRKPTLPTRQSSRKRSAVATRRTSPTLA